MVTKETDYVEVTELANDDVSHEQVERMHNRYSWALDFCNEKDVLEVACGTGQGLGMLNAVSNSLVAGDYSEALLEIARKYYDNRIDLQQFDAHKLPFNDESLDIIIIFEALYYLKECERFVLECKRTLRSRGQVLIATANKDLYDFNPSPHSYKYYGVVELKELFGKYGFESDFYGYMPIDKISLQQKVLRPFKKIIVSMNLMPKTMKGKKLLKRLVFGKMIKMPNELKKEMLPYTPPKKIDNFAPEKKHKVLYCCATLK